MSKITKPISRIAACAALVSAMLLTGCLSDIKSDIEDLKRRVRSLEEVTGTLSQQLENGSLVKSVTPLADGSGFRIEFVSGDDSRADLGAVEILHGEDGKHGVTPRIEVRTNKDGTVTIWHNTESGYPTSGWVNTGVNVKGSSGSSGSHGSDGSTGPKGDKGDKGDPGDSGDDAFVKFGVAEDAGTTGSPLSIWYTTDEEVAATAVSAANGWTVLLPIDKVGPIAAVTENNDGTVTFIMNDSSFTEYVFPKYQQTPTGIAVVKVEKAFNGEFMVTFRVNPSTAVIPTGSEWLVDQIGTRQSYDITPAPFNATSGLIDPGKSGQYIATLTEDGYDPSKTYSLALVLKVDNALISSDSFEVSDAATPEANLIDLIPEGGFRDWIRANVAGSDGKLTGSEILTTTQINESGDPAATSLAGIGYFTNLEELTWTGGALAEEVILHANTKLERVDLSDNDITGLWIGGDDVTEINVSGNQLTNFDPTFYPALEVLNLSGNPMHDGLGGPVSLPDFSNNAALRELNMSGIDLSAGHPDMSLLVNLISLDFSDTQLPAVNVTENPALEYLDLGGNAVASLDVTNNPALKHLDLGGNAVSSLNVTNNPALEYLDVGGNQLPSLDLVTGGKTSLTYLDVSGNPFPDYDHDSDGSTPDIEPGLNFSSAVNIEKLYVANCDFSGLNVSALAALQVLDCTYNDLTSIDIQANPQLTVFKCEGNIGSDDGSSGYCFPVATSFGTTPPSPDFTTTPWNDGTNDGVYPYYH
jgi:Leucine-rich repeat (LRR) protein